MRNALTVVGLILLVALLLPAQSTGGSSIAFVLSGNGCTAPAANMGILCAPTTGDVTWSSNGSPANSLRGASGPAGAQGFAGPPGATGPMGPPGPSGTLAGPICVTISADLKGNLVITPVTCK